MYTINIVNRNGLVHAMQAMAHTTSFTFVQQGDEAPLDVAQAPTHPPFTLFTGAFQNSQNSPCSLTSVTRLWLVLATPTECLPGYETYL